MAEQDRAPRESKSRTQEARPPDTWVPPSNMPEPKPRDGIVHRWIRTSNLGQSDIQNVSTRFREGWVPVKREDYPELHDVMVDQDSRFPENVEVGGLLLCAAPRELMDQRKDYYNRLAGNQMESVDNNFMRENDPRMPLLDPERKTRTTFGES